jgi:hypothetical protein
MSASVGIRIPPCATIREVAPGRLTGFSHICTGLRPAPLQGEEVLFSGPLIALGHRRVECHEPSAANVRRAG